MLRSSHNSLVGLPTGGTKVARLEKPFAVPGARAPRCTAATPSGESGEHDSDDSEDSVWLLIYWCDGCRGPLYSLRLTVLAGCSLCDELYTDLSWCEWCRTFSCAGCLRIMTTHYFDSSDDSVLSD